MSQYPFLAQEPCLINSTSKPLRLPPPPLSTARARSCTNLRQHRRRPSFSRTASPRTPSTGGHSISFLNLTPTPTSKTHHYQHPPLITPCSPKFDEYSFTLALANQGYTSFVIGQRSPVECLVPDTPPLPTTTRPRGRSLSSKLLNKLTMPSFLSSSSSPKDPQQKKYRTAALPPPFMASVYEYQFLNGGSEKNAIRAILKERGLSMSVEEARVVFGEGGDGNKVGGGVYRDDRGGVWMDEDESWEYKSLMPQDGKKKKDGWKQFKDDDATSSSSSGSSSPPPPTTSKKTRRRPAPLSLPGSNSNINLPNAFNDSFNPHFAAVSQDTISSAGTGRRTPSAFAGGMKGMFKIGKNKRS